MLQGAMTRWIPTWLRALLRRDGVEHRSIHDNVYHCTVQKCASQWIRAILADPRIFRWSGLRPYRYQDDLPGQHDPRPLTQRRFDSAFPESTIATTVYVDFDGFASIPKPASYKAFFVMRDPRDVLVSWYFSSRYSHPLMGDLGRVREDLGRLSEADGLLYCIDYLEEFGLFAAMRSWIDADVKDGSVLLTRYEDLTGADSRSRFAELLAHCDIRVPVDELDALLRSYRFEALSGRKRGQEDRASHHRKGVAGDWRNHFTDQVGARFEHAAGDLLSLWRYS
ncbi:MAG: sulfotransferase domain-containing protein [Planctomycetes bacterium]|nr:sulfotransferase domain-containing protein [Planctomycetota bacterium]